MTRRLIHYTYRIVDMGCGCCHEGRSEYSVWENGVPIVADQACSVMGDEQDLRDYFPHLEPFDIHSECEFF